MSHDAEHSNESKRGALDESAKRTRVTLLEKIKNPTDREAWDRFYNRYHSLIRSLAQSYVRVHGLRLKEADVDDVVMRVIESINQKAGDFVYVPGKRAFRGYLATMTYRRCIDAQRAMDARPGSEPHPPQITDEEGEENRPDQRPGRGGLPRTAKPERVGVDSAKPGCPEPKLPKRDPAKAAKKMEVIYGELFGERTGELSKLIESHDMEVGRLLALEKLRADKRVSAGQFQMFEKLAMGVPVADVCSQLGLSANQVYITRNRVLPIYEDALAAAKAELDEPTILPKSPVV